MPSMIWRSTKHTHKSKRHQWFDVTSEAFNSLVCWVLSLYFTEEILQKFGQRWRFGYLLLIWEILPWRCDGFCYLCFIFMTLRTVTYKRQELFTLPEHLGFGRVRLAHLFSLMSCFVFLCFVCLRPVSCVHNVVSVSGFTILDCPIGFL